VSDDPADWVRQLRDSIRVDPDVPPGLLIVESGPERLARWGGHPGGLVTDALWEDLQSWMESFPYTIRLGERGQPIVCEVCGTLVALTPEASGARAPWKPGIWEYETYRRHTQRRCEWKRANP